MHCEKEDLPSFPMWKENLSGQCLFGLMAFLVRRCLEHREKMGLIFCCFFPRGATTLDILTIWLPGTADYCLWWLRRIGWRDFNKTSLGAWEKAWTSSDLHGLGCNPQNCLSWLPSFVFLHHLIDQDSMSHTSTTWVKLQPESWDLHTGPIIYPFIDLPFHEWKDWKKKQRKQKCKQARFLCNYCSPAPRWMTAWSLFPSRFRSRVYDRGTYRSQICTE